MHPTSSDDLGHRVAALERALTEAASEITALHRSLGRARLVTRVLAMLGVAGVAAASYSAVTSAQGVGQTVTAPFEVVDAAGNKILQVRQDSAGEQNQLMIYNRGGQPAAIMMANGARGYLSVTDGSGRRPEAMKVILSVNADGSGIFGMRDGDGQLMADLLQGSSGSRGMFIYNKDGEPVARLMSTTEDGGQISVGTAEHQSGIVSNDEKTMVLLTDPSGARVLEATSKSPNGRRGLWVFNPKGTAVATAQVQESGAGRVSTTGPDGGEGAGFFYTDQGSTFALMRKNGKAKFQVASDGLGLYDESGQTPVVWLSAASNTGKLQLADVGGQIIVEAGATTDGRGVVRAGPLIGGIVGLQGIPYAIMGKK